MSRTTARLARSYTDSDWEDESYALNVERADPPPCPRCSRTGFFGPRAMDPGRKFRSCRFCGFWQEVGKKPVRFRPVAHDCEGWPQCAKAPYIWWVEPNEKWFHCVYCGKRAPVEGSNPFAKGVLVGAPSDDQDHPWWRVPQNRPYQFYYRFWENWPVTKGRAYL